MAAIDKMRNSNDSISQIAKILRDQNQPLTERFRALFTLRNLGGKKAINAIAGIFSDPSALLKHELAYCLGQMQDDYAVSILTEVLQDENQEVIVRHEAGEVLSNSFKSRYCSCICTENSISFSFSFSSSLYDETKYKRVNDCRFFTMEDQMCYI